jgi:uncharacterized protein (DUF1778 family)
MVTEAKRASNDAWDKDNMVYQTVKVRKEILAAFKAAVAANGDKVNTVLREAMERYTEGGNVPHDSEVTTCGGADGVKLEPEAIQAAQVAAELTGETVTEYITRAINDTAKRDEQLRAIGFQQQFLKHKTAE